MRKLFVGLVILIVLNVASFARATSVVFEWNHNGIGVTEFRIYASGTSGVYDKDQDLLIKIPFTGTQDTYTGEATIAAALVGTEVYFVATAVKVEDNVVVAESAYSNEVSATIPPDQVLNFEATIKLNINPVTQ